MIYDVLLLMLCTFSKGLFLNSCTFFKGLFALFCHFFKGLSVAKIQNFLLKGKENGNYFLFKGKVFLSLRLFLYFCNIILKIGVPDSRGMLYYEQSRIIKTRKMMKRTTSLILCLVLSISLFAQSRGVTFQVHNETLTSVLKKIEKAGEKNILFAYQTTDPYRVTANIQAKRQKEALEMVLQGKPFSFVEHNTYFAVQYTGKTTRVEQIKGRVVDEHQQPLPFANVVLISSVSKAYVAGCVTAEDGSFVLPYADKDVMLKVSFVGYKSQTLACKPTMHIGLHPDTQQLKAVTIKSTRPNVVYKDGAFSTLVSGTILGELGSAEDMISQLPFVSGEAGSWEIIGRGAPEIYLNGRKLENLNELKRLSAKDILKAEIVTVPGAQYSSKTNAVIRLRAVRKRGQGLSGSLYSEYVQGRYSPHTYDDVQLNYRTGGLDIFGEVGVGLNRSHTTAHSETQLHTTSDWEFNSRRTTNANSGDILLNTGFNYEISEKQSLGMRYETTNMIGNNYTHSWGATDVWEDGKLTESMGVDLFSKSKPHWSHSVNAYYNGDFGKWNINFNGDFYNKVSQSTQTAINDGQLDAESESKVKSNLYAAKLVVSGPLWKGRLSFGTEEMFTNRRNDFTQSGFSADAFNHIRQSIYAGFLEYYLNIGHMNYGAGLRYEYQKTDYYEKDVLQAEQSPSYRDWIPFASIGYSKNNLNLAFSYRLNKYSPIYVMLQSSIDYDSKYEYYSGDPHLKPQKQHSFNLSGNYKWLSFTAYYNYVLDMYMTWYKPYDEVNHPSVLLQTMASVPHSYYCGANIRVAPSFGIWYPNLTASVFFCHDNIDHLNIPKFGKNQPQFTFSMNNNLRLPHRWFMNLSGNISTKAEMGIGRRKCTGNMQFRVSKNFMKNDALKVMFVVQDLLHTGYYYSEANGTQSHRTFTRYADNQKILMNVRYTFNATKNKYKGSGAGQSEKQRL